MAEQNPPGEQPNLDLWARQILNLANMPALRQGDKVLRRLDEMQLQMQRNHTQMQRNHTHMQRNQARATLRINRRFDQLEASIQDCLEEIRIRYLYLLPRSISF
jgi:hypothetical protein